jgi:hypothetical protein
MRSPFASRVHRSPKIASRRRANLLLDRLEDRRMLAILPGQIVPSAGYFDADGDSVSITVTGPLGAGAGFSVELAGLATDNADATRINLSGLTKDNGLQIVVTPTKLAEQAGGNFATLYSSGYTNIAFISNNVDPTDNWSTIVPLSKMASLGGIQLSAAVVNSISLDGIAVGSITLDAGQAPFIDRINTQNNQQAADSKFYMPVTGLIDLGGITAASIDSLVINGAISAPTGHPYDTSVTNDFRSVVNVSGAIGSVIGLRSSLSGAIRANSIGSVRVAAIAGEITTRGSDDLAINLPSSFKGFINSGGHLHLGFPLSDGSLITGQINAAGGISGSDKSSTTDTLYLPGAYAGSFTNTSTVTGIATIEVDGEAMLVVSSASSVGNVSADAFTGDFLIEAGTSIGNIEAGQGGMEGHLHAGTDIGTIKVLRGLTSTILAGGSIGTITTVQGGVESPSIQAGGNIGRVWAYAGILGTSIVAGGDFGTVNAGTGTLEAIYVPNGDLQLSYIRGRDIGSVRVVDGGMQTASFVADRDIGTITTFGSIGGFGLQDVSLVAARNIAAIDARAHTGYGIRLLKAEAGGDIAGISGISYGEFGSLDGAGILESNVVAANIGPVYGRGVGGTGIEDTKIVTRTAYDAGGVIDRSRGRIGAVTGDGWLDGLLNVLVVAHTDIASITGVTAVDGSGINGGSFDANYGTIGQITAAGGAAGGYGILETRFQATDLEVGRIAGITTSANANGRDAMSEAKVYAGSIGPIKATVHGGLDGNGIIGGEIRSFSGAIDSVNVDVRSINGIGILDGKITASGDLGLLTVKAFNAAAISGGEFQSRGNFGDITATAEKGGNAIENATFTAPGRIFYDDETTDLDPKGSFGKITASANGTNKLSNGIVGSTFNAIGDIGQITVRTKGGTAILDSIFAADTDGDYDPNPSPTSPGQATGTIAGIRVVAAGRNLLDSSGIVDSKFTAALIGPITAKIQTVEGGDGIVRSTFEARTSVYDGFGNFDNIGRIGAITVTNAADQLASGAGIRESKFFAGAAGGIGDLTVTTASGSGVVGSIFDASIRGVVFDLDQNLFTSTIGTITVTTGRVLNWTFTFAGITLSSFTAAAGIGLITVNSIGSGITGSIFEADFDWQLVNSAPGNIAGIAVRVPGRNASAVTGSLFGGAGIGNIDVRLADAAKNGWNAIALSTFTARSGAIGNVTVVHSQTGVPYATGLGYAILTSTFSAFTGIGSISITGNTLGAVFIVAGQPVVARARAGGARALPQSIGPISILGGSTQDLSFSATSGIPGIAFRNAPSGASVKLALTAASVGDLLVDAPSGTASLDVSGAVTNFGNVTADGAVTIVSATATSLGNVVAGGNATLNTPALQTLGSLNVGGTLSLPQDLASLRQVGAFTVNALASATKNVRIGSSATSGSSIGPIRIATANRGKGTYQFAFATWPANPTKANPVAIIGGKSIVAPKTTAQTVNGVSIVKSKK